MKMSNMIIATSIAPNLRCVDDGDDGPRTVCGGNAGFRLEYDLTLKTAADRRLTCGLFGDEKGRKVVCVTSYVCGKHANVFAKRHGIKVKQGNPL